MQATTSPKFVDQQQTILVALAAILFAVGIALGGAMDLDLKIAPAAATVSAPDTSYDAVEKTRAQSGIAPDTSYDAVEKTRAQSGIAPDTSYDQVESLRAQSGVTVATEYDVLHAARAKAAAARAKAGASGFPSTRGASVAGTPVSQAEPNDRYGAGIR